MNSDFCSKNGVIAMVPEMNEGVPLERIKEFPLEKLLEMVIKAEIGAGRFYESFARLNFSGKG